MSAVASNGGGSRYPDAMATARLSPGSREDGASFASYRVTGSTWRKNRSLAMTKRENHDLLAVCRKRAGTQEVQPHETCSEKKLYREGGRGGKRSLSSEKHNFRVRSEGEGGWAVLAESHPIARSCCVGACRGSPAIAVSSQRADGGGMSLIVAPVRGHTSCRRTHTAVAGYETATLN